MPITLFWLIDLLMSVATLRARGPRQTMTMAHPTIPIRPDHISLDLLTDPPRWTLNLVPPAAGSDENLFHYGQNSKAVGL